MRGLAILFTLSAACEPAAEQKPATSQDATGSAAPATSSHKSEETNGMGSAVATATPTTKSRAELVAEINSPGGLWGDEGDPRRPLLPSIRMGATAVTGRLPPEIIQRVMRQNFGKLLRCYEAALRKDPAVSGRITTSFTIDATGSSKDAKSSGEIRDKDMLACIEKAFSSVQYPAPESGVVKVVYPVVLRAPAYTFTIDDKPSAMAQEVDVVKALEAAGYKVTGAASASQPGTAISRFKAENAGVTFSITLDPDARLALDDYKKLKKEAALLQDGQWCMFVESSDKTASQSLLDAIHKKLPAK